MTLPNILRPPWRRAAMPLLAALAALLALIAAPPIPAAAQDPDRADTLYTGDHHIRVVRGNHNLGAGSAQYSVFVTDPATGAPTADARVVMVAAHHTESNPGWAIATNSPAAPERYDVHLKLDATGQWNISVDVSSPLGADMVAVATLEVPSLNRLTQGSWVFFGMFAIIMLGIAYVWWSARRDYRRKRTSPSDVPPADTPRPDSPRPDPL